MFIDIFNWGMSGAGWATTISHLGCASFIIYFYVTGKGELKVKPSLFKLKKDIIGETFKIGSVTLVRQGTISLLAILLNNTLYYYGSLAGGIGGEVAISVYGLATRMAMFALFPLIGIAQGFMPIAGYNFGAKNFGRVKLAINISLIYGLLVSIVITTILLLSSNYIIYIYSRCCTYKIWSHSYILDFYLNTNFSISSSSPFLFSSYWKGNSRLVININ